MNKDIRVEIEFFDHRKTRKLIARFGLKAAWGLLRLWAFAARSRCNGCLTGMSNLDIAMEMHVEGKISPDELIAFMKSDECRWIDDTLQGQYLHDWHIHNPWAAGANDRSDKARFSHMAQTHPIIFKQLLNNGITAITQTEYQRLTTPQRTVNEPLNSVGASLAPSPSPSPSPKSNTLSGKSESLPDKIPYQEIIDYLNGKTGQKYRAQSKDTREHIKARWEEGATVSDFKKAIDNMSAAWLSDTKMCPYLRPATLFAKGKFEGYVNYIRAYSGDPGLKSPVTREPGI